MFSEYLYEIIAAIIVVALVIIFAIIKSSSSKEIKKQEEISSDITPDEAKQESTQKATLKTPKEEIESQEVIEDAFDLEYEGSEEGDFGQEQEDTPTADMQIKKRYKREVPAHSKITKQNFTEFSGQRILVAEDNLINQKVITGLLAGSGIDVTIADDGQDALDILEKDDDFLMILMDAHMPRVDGFEATRLIRKNPNYDHILVVALSGDTAADDIAKMEDAGMEEQLEKPLRMEALYNIFYAYTGEAKENNDESDEIEVIMTKELNGDKGLGICGGDDNFYKEILKEFVTDYSDSALKLQEYLENDKIPEADQLLLDIIGVTANIGADTLHDIANDIKSTLTDKEEKSYLSLVSHYTHHLELLIQDINDYL